MKQQIIFIHMNTYCSNQNIRMLLQANKPAIIKSSDSKYPPITAEEFVRESLRAIYVKAEA